MPMEPVSMAAASDNMSPKIFPVTMTSNCFGARMSIIAAASTNRCVSSTSGYCVETHVTTSRHNCPVSRTLALSTEQTLLRRLRSEEHTSELQSLMSISYAVFCLKKKNQNNN